MNINRILYIILLCIIWQINPMQAQTVDTVCASAKGEVYKINLTPGSLYFWSVEGGTIIHPANAAYTSSDSIVVNWGSTPGRYKIRVVERNAFGCRGDTITAEIVINENLNVWVVGQTEICRGEAVLLNAGGASNYKWNTGQLQQQILVQPDQDTDYFVVGYGNECQQDTAWIKINVHDKPKADFSYSPKKPGIGETVNFIAKSSGANQYKWFFEDENNVSSNDANPDFVFAGYGEKRIKLIVTNAAGCADTIIYKIVIDDEVKIFIPNAFTPNENGQNETFTAVSDGIMEFHMDIYNRWGEKIFETDDIAKGWDGTYKGEKVQEGVYFYQLRAKGINKRNYYMNGQVTMIY